MKRIPVQQIIDNAEYYAQLSRSNWSTIIQPSGIGNRFWSKLFQYFPDYQIFFEDSTGRWLGFANTIPLCYNDHFDNLPEEGWDWLLERGIKGFESKLSPNLLGGLQIGVNPQFRGQGLSKYILDFTKKLVKVKELQGFILPIRPTVKDQYPEIPMEEYMHWKNDGKIFDPWIRTHISAGAKIIKVCNKAMSVEGNVSQWESWTGKTFTNSGRYHIEGGLSLVDIDLENDKGTYLEPNIWIYYP